MPSLGWWPSQVKSFGRFALLLTVIQRRLLEPLKKGNIKETVGGSAQESASNSKKTLPGIEVGLMDAYGLRREHLVEHLTELRQHVGSQDMRNKRFDQSVQKVWEGHWGFTKNYRNSG